MAVFHLKIMTPTRTVFDALAKSVVLRSTEGDVCIMSGHEDYVAPLGVGLLKLVTQEDEVREGAAAYGFVNVSSGLTCVFLMTFEFANEIDLQRAKDGMERARLIIAEGLVQGDELSEAKAHYARCKSRIEIATRAQSRRLG